MFNPVKQGREHDPDGAYIRRYVPELRDVPGAAVHEPWTLPGGLPAGYPERVVDHAAERGEALRRYARRQGLTAGVCEVTPGRLGCRCGSGWHSPPTGVA